VKVSFATMQKVRPWLFCNCKRELGLGQVRKPEEYQEYSLQCLWLGERASEPGSKAFLLEMAQAWIRLADHFNGGEMTERRVFVPSDK
jgi:hypothetical protein